MTPKKERIAPRIITQSVAAVSKTMLAGIPITTNIVSCRHPESSLINKIALLYKGLIGGGCEGRIPRAARCKARYPDYE